MVTLGSQLRKGRPGSPSRALNHRHLIDRIENILYCIPHGKCIAATELIYCCSRMHQGGTVGQKLKMRHYPKKFIPPSAKIRHGTRQKPLVQKLQLGFPKWLRHGFTANRGIEAIPMHFPTNLFYPYFETFLSTFNYYWKTHGLHEKLWSLYRIFKNSRPEIMDF